ncbi:MAG: hypothetical protein HY012_00995 [Acidobacteria bacterium]|nr:hypothetical protein [Acidobacteriota bacterium]
MAKEMNAAIAPAANCICFVEEAFIVRFTPAGNPSESIQCPRGFRDVRRARLLSLQLRSV